jgi:predicted phage baseplate assembly protein
MPLPDINLDDRSFERLVADAKRRIPAYTPEWTDLSESDPGITLVELFAWLTEMILWRLNRVPEKNYFKFLELIGIVPKLPTPAQAHLTFALVKTQAAAPRGYVVPQGTKVALAEQVDGKPVVFETDDNLFAIDADLDALQSFDGARFDILDEAHRIDGKYFYPLSAQPQRGAAFYIGFTKPFPAGTPVALMIYTYAAGLIAQGKGIEAFSPPRDDPSVTDSDANFSVNDATARADTAPPPVAGVWEYWAGEATRWVRLDVRGDTSASLTQSGTLTFNPPAQGAMAAAKMGLLRKDEDPARYWLRFRIDQVLGRGYELAPRLEQVLTNTISATNATTVEDELLGASNARANQIFALANAPVLPAPFELDVDEGSGAVTWTRVRDFAASGPGDLHYVVDFANGRVLFGDGEHGKIPARLADPDRPEDDLANVRARRYRWGGGARGNAGAHKINSLQSSVPYVDSVDNARPATGGQDEETLNQVKARAPDYLRTRSRAVTASDFEFLAEQTPGVRIRRARAMPLVHPELAPRRPAGAGLQASTVAMPGVVTVIVVPEALDDDPKPIPNEETLTRVGAWLNQHRLVTTELFVVAPIYRKVEVTANVVVKDTASSGDVQQTLERLLSDYFHPLRGGDGEGWEFGSTISFAEIYRRILDIPGVKSVDGQGLTIFVDDARVPGCTDVPLNPGELTYSGRHQVVAKYAGR